MFNAIWFRLLKDIREVQEGKWIIKLIFVFNFNWNFELDKYFIQNKMRSNFKFEIDSIHAWIWSRKKKRLKMPRQNRR